MKRKTERTGCLQEAVTRASGSLGARPARPGRERSLALIRSSRSGAGHSHTTSRAPLGEEKVKVQISCVPCPFALGAHLGCDLGVRDLAPHPGWQSHGGMIMGRDATY